MNFNYIPNLREILFSSGAMVVSIWVPLWMNAKANRKAHTKREVENALMVQKLEKLEEEQKTQFGGNSNGIRQKVDSNASIEKEHNDVVVKALETFGRELKAVSLISNETATILREHIRWAEAGSTK